MDLHEKIRTLPARPGVYLYRNADGEVIYVGKAKNLRSRVRSYILDGAQANAWKPVVKGIKHIERLVFAMMRLVVRAAPLAAFAAMAFTMATCGATVLRRLLGLVAAVYGTSFLFIFVVLGAIAFCSAARSRAFHLSCSALAFSRRSAYFAASAPLAFKAVVSDFSVAATSPSR